MKFVVVAVFMAIHLAVDVHSASVAYSISNDKLTVKGTVDVHLNIPIEEVWDGLSKSHRYPIINSGDTIALRSAYTYGSYSKKMLFGGTDYCPWTTCQGGTIITSSRWTSCSPYMMLTITAKGKMDGEPINSGDTVSLSSNGHGSSYRLHCTASSSSMSNYCRVGSTTSSMTGSAWLTYSYLTFEIYSKNADDGTPVQYGDVVGFKYPYNSNSAWLTYYGDRFYARSCSSSSKTSCAAENTWTGLKIFKKLS